MSAVSNHPACTTMFSCLSEEYGLVSVCASTIRWVVCKGSCSVSSEVVFTSVCGGCK